ncbi:hypothetical protein Ahy_A04g019147 [Arachis hypogaea]|uniref:Uncharacterized protein n=1 Tax=Arachis hypogaea TaxID=3818 RepID=A0A445DFE4_ARAHY|nr:hypothetical protein Ahy_A04g019147 [Arachis hypogaea]
MPKSVQIIRSSISNPDPNKLSSIYVPVDVEEFSDKNAGHHCYKSEELRSIASDEDACQPPVFPQNNVDASVSQIRLELGMEFETLNHFKKTIQKFNINIGRSIFFSRLDTREGEKGRNKWRPLLTGDDAGNVYKVQCLPVKYLRPPVLSQEFWEKLDTVPILLPCYRKSIGRHSLKRDKRNDGPAEPGHNKKSYKKRKEAMAGGNGAPQEHVAAGDEDPNLLAEMYWEKTLEVADAEAAGTGEGSGSATP